MEESKYSYQKVDPSTIDVLVEPVEPKITLPRCFGEEEIDEALAYFEKAKEQHDEIWLIDSRHAYSLGIYVEGEKPELSNEDFIVRYYKKDKKTLHLNLKREWFDLIASGEKKEEYRAITNYWANRLFEYDWAEEYPGEHKNVGENIDYDVNVKWHIPRRIERNYHANFKTFDSITFSNGYAKDRDQLEIEIKEIKIDTGFAKWGAPRTEERMKRCFVLKLGNILNRNF